MSLHLLMSLKVCVELSEEGRAVYNLTITHNHVAIEMLSFYRTAVRNITLEVLLYS